MAQLPLLIVGAGPTGLTMALECIRHGIDFRIVDKSEAASTQSKALAIWTGTLESLSPIGITPDILGRGLQVKAFKFADRGNVLASFDCAEGVDSLFPQPRILPQNDTEALLLEHLTAKGRSVERGVQLIDLKEAADHVAATLTHPDGAEEIAEFSYMAGCDGARSACRHLLNVDFPGSTEAQTFLLFDGEIEGHDEEPEFMASWSGDGSVASFPVRTGTWRIICQRENADDLSEPRLEEIQAMVERHGPPGWKLKNPLWLSTFRIHERLAANFRVGRVFLVGDAAHIHSPAGGQGMNTGIQDACNLSWKIAAALKSGATNVESHLDSYELERRPVAEGVLKGASDKLHFGLAHGLLARIIKDIAVTTVMQSAVFRRHMAFELSELGVHYAENALILADAWSYSDGGFAPGSRPRSAVVRTADGQPIDLWEKWMHAGHTLMIFSGPDLDAAVDTIQLAREAAGEGPLILTIWHGASVPQDWEEGEILLDPDGSAHQRFGMRGAGWYWIRPDLYVAARSQPVCLETLQVALNRFKS